MSTFNRYTIYLIPSGIFLGLVASLVSDPFNPWKTAFFGLSFVSTLKDLVSYIDNR